MSKRSGLILCALLVVILGDPSATEVTSAFDRIWLFGRGCWVEMGGQAIDLVCIEHRIGLQDARRLLAFLAGCRRAAPKTLRTPAPWQDGLRRPGRRFPE